MTIGEDFPGVLEAAQHGDAAAIERLYRDTAGLVIGYLRANGGIDPEDLASDVFVSMMSGLDGFTGGEREFRSWLLTITHRRLVDGFRRSSRRREDPIPVEELGEQVIDLTAGEPEAMARLRSMGILAAIDELTDDQRAVLLLRALADLPIKEIAEVVDKPETAVKALLRRAVASLGRLLDERDLDTG